MSVELLILTKDTHKSKLIDCTPWWVFITVPFNHKMIILGIIYITQNIYLEVIPDVLQELLNEIDYEYPSHIFILSADLNATVGEADC